ncbi:Hypothetical protein GSB_151058 [Giardia duodenalis]|uniref:FAD/NAD(P)-binding domain-containing protein n=2 Tax=Giardia intestinalis TaxID=5741 RepID=C6LXI5_GIAIB|nr:Hypothetical protein GL50581_3499 [Giardia intestinalis ATCC 50581]ESU43977.1 Hypothetical protein GSB_151058 [Giardia intestinalis]
MRRVDVLVIGNGPRAVAVADHALSLGLSTVIASAGTIVGGDKKLIYETYECTRLNLAVKPRILQIEGATYTMELGFVSLVIAPEPAVGLQSEKDNPYGSLENSFYTSRREDDHCCEEFFTDECMEILMIRNAHIIAQPNSILSLCSSSVLRYLQASANLKIHTQESTGNNQENLLKSHQIFAPVDPIKLAKVSITARHGAKTALSIRKCTCKKTQLFFETTVPRVYVLKASYPVVQQADEIFRRQVFPCHIYQQKHPQGRMIIEYSPGRRIILYGKQKKTLDNNRNMYITVRLPSRGDCEQESEIYVTQLGVVLGFVLFLPEMADLIAPLTLCCDNNFSIVRLLSCLESMSQEIDNKQAHLAELVLAYYKETSNDKTVYKALQMSFRYRGMIKALLLLSPILLLAALMICALLIF